jgi:hypothetical protein
VAAMTAMTAVAAMMAVAAMTAVVARADERSPMPEREQLSLFQFSSCRRMVAVAMEATTVAGHAGKGPCRVQGTEGHVVVAACWGAATRVEMRVETGGGRSGLEVVAEVVADTCRCLARGRRTRRPEKGVRTGRLSERRDSDR